MLESNSPDRVADAPADTMVHRLFPRSALPYAQLARWDRPIGWQLLMWPCFWSAALAAGAQADLNDGAVNWGRLIVHLLLFAIGAIAMRGAGCTYNDLVDHEIDSQVARTRSRPLPSGRIGRGSAKTFLLVQALVGFLVLIQFNGFSILLGILSLAVVAVYPYAKRVTDWPQLVLGLAFSWGGLMGWAAEFGTLSLASILLYLGAVAWTVGYDTIYAHQDAEDDALVGVRSTALLFGEQTRRWLIGLYGGTVALFALAFLAAGAGWPAYIGLAAAAGMLGWQLARLDISDPKACLALFKFNSAVGAVVFAGLFAALFI